MNRIIVFLNYLELKSKSIIKKIAVKIIASIVKVKKNKIIIVFCWK